MEIDNQTLHPAHPIPSTNWLSTMPRISGKCLYPRFGESTIRVRLSNCIRNIGAFVKLDLYHALITRRSYVVFFLHIPQIKTFKPSPSQYYTQIYIIVYYDKNICIFKGNCKTRIENAKRLLARKSYKQEMHVLPFQPPQSFKIPPRFEATDASLEANEQSPDDIAEPILQTMALPESNTVVMLTPTRVLIYNFKPMALVSSHERSSKSITEFGLNKFAISNSSYNHRIEGLISREEHRNFNKNQEKLLFYVITEKNFILVYQLLTNTNPFTTFKEYGIHISDLNTLERENEQDPIADDTDAEVLTVFDKRVSHKIIQNGYTVDKQRGFFQFLTNTTEALDELPIRKLDLRLKIVLKFDHEIIDVVGFSEDGGDDQKSEERLVILFSHGLQLLNLREFKLEDNVLIEIHNGTKIVINSEKLVVVSLEPDGTPVINIVDFAKRTVYSKSLNLTLSEKLLISFSIENIVVLAYESELIYYNINSRSIVKRLKLSIQIKHCNKLTQDTILLLTRGGNIHILTKWGNTLFSTSYDDDDERFLSFDFTSFTHADSTIVTATKSGDFQVWSLWEEVCNVPFDSRHPKPHILRNHNNDIMLYSPVGDSTNHVDFQIIRLPTKTLNNYTPLVRANSSLNTLAIYVANKNILLLHDLASNTWSNFPGIRILDMGWLGNNYLVAHIMDDDQNEFIHCYHLPFQHHEKIDLEDHLVWSHPLSESLQISGIYINTLARYKLLKVKKSKENEDEIENLFKTGEVILSYTNDTIVVFDVISVVHPAGVNIVKKFFQQGAYKFPKGLVGKFDWVLSFKEGFLALRGSDFLKIEKIDDNSWQSTVLLSKVERILDIVLDEIFLIHENSFVTHDLNDLWDDKPYSVSIPIIEDEYPVAVSPDKATVHSVHSVFRESFSKVIVHHTIYLDQVIENAVNRGMSNGDINSQYCFVRHYKFALEKILSAKVLNNEPLDSILELIDLYDLDSGKPLNNSGKLEIISNCLRKIETKHWDHLFANLKLSPKDLLSQCIDQNQARILGVLLMVFLNYEGDPTEIDAQEQSKKTNGSNKSNGNRKKNSNKKKKKKNDKRKAKELPSHLNSSVAKVLTDEELILQVLKVLVINASSSTVLAEAQEFWDMSFQLVRFLSALDKENGSDLVQKAVTLLR